MKGRLLWIVIVANLLVLLALVFVYPHLMVAPGALLPGHASLTTDCFACHAPLRGAASGRCVACHAVADIGLRTTKGIPLSGSPAPKVAFHQALVEQDCMACHTDHAGAKLTRHARKSFSHALLPVATRARCEACHTGPDNDLHRNLRGGCGQCHTPPAWKPATFDHTRHFLLDGDHDTTCATCHTGGDYGRYTCFGCHEHTPANVRRKHEKEGIRNFEHCAECHRSADGDPDGRRDRD